ncbi:MAG: cell division protein FtsZ, partial [Pseudomonadota bacterium]
AAGMGGGTGTGAAPVMARIARELGILTVGVVTKPFGFEHARRMTVAEEGVEDIRQFVDTLIVVPNQNLFRIANERTSFSDAFRMVDDVLYSGVRGITDLMVMPGLINLDFADVRAVMAGMGTAMMGMGEAEGEGRALMAARAAIDNPLLDDVSMKGAKGVLINITGGYDMTLFELDEAANEIRSEVDSDANVIIGSAFDETLNGRLRISVVAAGVGQGAVAATPPATPKSADPQDDFVAPVVVTPHRAPPAETDTRSDFEGRDLPAAHIESKEGEEQVSLDAVLARAPVQPTVTVQPSTPEAPAEAGDDGDGVNTGFSNLFGWRRNGAESEAEPTDETAAPVSAESESPAADPAPFDDDDLEIPAFLRRSANH